MTIETTSVLSNAVGTRYDQKYQRAAAVRRLYDQLAGNIKTAPQHDLESRRGMGTTYTFNFASDLTPGTTAISETTDITHQTIIDATSTITPTSRGEGIKWSELLDLEAYTDFVAFRAEKVGENAMETIDNQAQHAALGGSLVIRQAARTSLSAIITSHNWNEAACWKAFTMAESMKMPVFVDGNGARSLLAIAHSDAFYDLFHSGNVLSAIQYGGLPGNILFNGEIGMIANFKLIISPFAKVFGGAGLAATGGAADSTYTVGGTDGTAAKALDKTIWVTTGTNVAYGKWLTIGTEETGTTFYDTNERVIRVSGTTALTFIGEGANGGLRFPHTTSEYVNNSDCVYPVAYGSPQSLAKVFASDVGEFGKLIGPKLDGSLEQWTELNWKWYGGYGRVAENRVLRGEYSSSLDLST